MMGWFCVKGDYQHSVLDEPADGEVPLFAVVAADLAQHLVDVYGVEAPV